MKWLILDTGLASAQANMEQDIKLLEGLSANPTPLVHFYEWERESATYGHFLNPSSFVNLKALSDYGLELARRPTGGGLVFHLTDFAFSIVIPSSYPGYSSNTLESYAFVNQIVAKVVSPFLRQHQPSLWMGEGCCIQDPLSVKENRSTSPSFCMAKPTKYDVMVGGKKVGGAAQRRTKFGFLHQGTISLTAPPWTLFDKWILDQKILEAMKGHTFCLAEEMMPGLEADQKKENEKLFWIREEIKKGFKEEVKELFNNI